MININFKDIILFEDEDYIVVNKPSYVSTLNDRNEKINILSLAKEYEASAQVCHRLDKETSGILAIAKNPEAYRALSMQFEDRSVIKIYHAVADGLHSYKDFFIDKPIQALSKGNVRIDWQEGKPSATMINTLKAYKMHTLLECRPVTGRMHQIRIHLASIKAPIAGDEMYGGQPVYLSTLKRKFNLKKFTEELPLIKRVALHAFSLQFQNMKGSNIFVEAPYPKDFNVLLKQLEKNN